MGHDLAPYLGVRAEDAVVSYWSRKELRDGTMCSRGGGTRAQTRAIRSSGSSKRATVPSFHGTMGVVRASIHAGSFGSLRPLRSVAP
jgi:hypothetical protein